MKKNLKSMRQSTFHVVGFSILSAILVLTTVACSQKNSDPNTSSEKNSGSQNTAKTASKPTTSERVQGTWDITSEIDQGVAEAMRKMAKSEEDYNNQIEGMKLAFSLMEGKETFNADGTFQRQSKISAKGKWTIEKKGSNELLKLTIDEGVDEQKQIVFDSDDQFHLLLVGGKLVFKRSKSEYK